MVYVAVVQINTTSVKQENLDKISKYVEQAAEKNCQLIAFPELFNCMVPKEKMKEESEDETGQTARLMKELAQKHNMYILAGSMLYMNDSLTLPQNKALFYAPDGSIAQEYAKMHLFDIDIPNKVTHFESKRISPGSGTANAITPFGNIGIAICYDLRFPELFTKLRNDGAEIIILPAAFTHETGKAHWEILIRARAIETQTFIVAPNQCGMLPIGIQTYGHSLICDPWGKILAEAEEEECIIYAHLDTQHLKKIRTEMPVWNHKVM